MKGNASYSNTGITVIIRSLLYASALSAGVMLSVAFAGDNYQDQLKSIQADIVIRQQAIQRQQQRRTTMLSQLKAQEVTISTTARQLRENQEILNQLNRQIEKLNTSIASLEQRCDAQTRTLSAQLEAAFRRGRDSGIQMILSGEEGQRNQRIQAYYGYLNQARQETISQLQQTRQQVAAQKSALESKKNQQQKLVYEQQTQQTKLEQTRKERKKTLSALESSIQKGQQQLSEMRANESQLRNRLTQVEAAARPRVQQEAREVQQVRERQQNASRQGTVYKPTESENSLIARTGGLGSPRGQNYWPVRGTLLHRYGERLQGELRWKGIVITASEGTEVRAIADGRVILADWLQGYGLVVVIEHGKGDMSLYGYNQSALVNVGTQIRAGQPIALVGNSGGQEQPSLYFEIRRQGQAVNPQPWLGR
ncbi:murein hydrolase activator EnvC [Enterobacteriaceae bacterium ESL0689]|nr:murein hydrolase activator EnvC [Enterobacteriaceae bacterium ESL0689]